MQAIITRYRPPTNTRGSRIVARCYVGHVTVSWDHALNVDQNHEAAAKTLAEKLGWLDGQHGTMHAGSLPDDTGYAFVFVRSASGS